MYGRNCQQLAEGCGYNETQQQQLEVLSNKKKNTIASFTKDFHICPIPAFVLMVEVETESGTAPVSSSC